MASPLNQLFFVVATIASVLAFSASPAAAVGESKLVQTLCSKNPDEDYNKACTSILNNHVGNSATSYVQLVDIILKLAQKIVTENGMELESKIKDAPSNVPEATLEAFKECNRKFVEASHAFANINNMDPERKMTSAYDMRNQVILARECLAALDKAQVEAVKLRNSVMTLALFSAMTHNAVGLQKGEENFKSYSGGEF